MTAMGLLSLFVLLQYRIFAGALKVNLWVEVQANMLKLPQSFQGPMNALSS